MVQKLHEEWFPVRYDDSFYDTLIDMNNTEFSLHPHPQKQSSDTTNSSKAENILMNATVAISYNNREMPNNMMQASSFMDDIEAGGRCLVTGNTCNGEHQTIVGCIISTFLRCTHKECIELYPLIIQDPFKFPVMLYIMTLGTARPYRRCGLGKEMVQQCIKLGETNKYCGSIYLNVITYNQAAIKFYENLGFMRITTIKGNCIPSNNWVFGKVSDLLYSAFQTITRSFSSLFSSARASDYEKAPLSVG